MAHSLARAFRPLQALSLALLTATTIAGPGMSPARAEVWVGPGVYRHYGPGFHPWYGEGVRPPYVVDPIRVNAFYNRPLYGWHPGWRNGGYWGYRPWATGWYLWTPSSWQWWGSSAPLWGVGALATGALITALVDTAATNRSPVIVVPQTAIRLNYASVEPVGTSGVSFRYHIGRGPAFVGAGNCRAGLLNGLPPQSLPEAELLNAACHVAYGLAGH